MAAEIAAAVTEVVVDKAVAAAMEMAAMEVVVVPRMVVTSISNSLRVGSMVTCW